MADDVHILHIVDDLANLADKQFGSTGGTNAITGQKVHGAKDEDGRITIFAGLDENVRFGNLEATGTFTWAGLLNYFNLSSNDSDDVTEGTNHLFLTAVQEIYVERIKANNLYGEVATVSTATFSVNGTYSKLLVTYTATGEVTLTFDASLETDSDWAGVLIIDEGANAYINNITLIVTGESDPFAIIDIDSDQVRVYSDGVNMIAEGFTE